MDFSFLVFYFFLLLLLFLFFRYFFPHTLGPACSLLRFIYILSFSLFPRIRFIGKNKEWAELARWPFFQKSGRKKLLEKYIKEIYCQLQRGYKTVSLSSIFIFPVFLYIYIIFVFFFPSRVIGVPRKYLSGWRSDLLFLAASRCEGQRSWLDKNWPCPKEIK